MTKTYRKFKKELQRRIDDKSGMTKLWQTFLHWYIEAQYKVEAKNFQITDGANDGVIDAVVLLPERKYIVIQSKYTERTQKRKHIPKKEYEKFDDIIGNFRNRKKFDEYIQTHNIIRKNIGIYRDVFNAYKNNKSKVTFEFITTYDRPNNINRQLKNLEPRNFKDFKDIIFLFTKYQERSTPPAPDITIDLEPKQKFMYEDVNKIIKSVVIRAYAKSFVKYLKDHPGDKNIISKNVRENLGSRKNDGILNTYENEPNEFWYSHNGITMICDKIERGKTRKQVIIKSPNVINGAQTIFTLARTDKIKDQATLLIKIFVINRSDDKTKDLIKKIIARTNTQNQILWRDLRANEPIMYDIQDYFKDRQIFFERRRGESNDMGRRLPITVKPYELSQIIQVCKEGAKGIISSKSNKEIAFENDEKFTKIFEKTTLTNMLVQFVLKKLTIDPMFKDERKKKGIRYVKMTTLGIFWKSIDSKKNNAYRDWREKINEDITIMDYRKHRELLQLKKCFRNLLEIYLKIQRDLDEKELKVFIHKSKGIEANEDAFNKTRSIQKQIRGILTEYFNKFDYCDYCGGITSLRNIKCSKCGKNHSTRKEK